MHGSDPRYPRTKPQSKGSHVSHSTRSQAGNTIIFFDWDDTMLASTVLVSNSINLSTKIVPLEIVQQFESLQDQVIRIIDIAFRYTKNVFIITNAERGWVELSAQKFMPRVYQYVLKLHVFSARSTFQEEYPNQPDAWKRCAFLDRIQACFPSTSRDYYGTNDLNIISFGDSECERTALMAITDICFPSARLKSIKLVERPTTEQLKRQLEMIENNFQFIVFHQNSLDLMLQISTTQQPPAPTAPAAQAPAAAQPASSAASSSSDSDPNATSGPVVHDPVTGAAKPYSSPDGRVPEEMRRQFEEQQKAMQDGGA